MGSFLQRSTTSKQQINNIQFLEGKKYTDQDYYLQKYYRHDSQSFNLNQKYLNIGHNTICKLYQFREEIQKCQFNNQQQKIRIIKHIEYLIQEIDFKKSGVLNLFEDASPFELKLTTDMNIKILNQWLSQEEINNNKEHLFKLIQEMNVENENCNKKMKFNLNKQLYGENKQKVNSFQMKVHQFSLLIEDYMDLIIIKNQQRKIEKIAAQTILIGRNNMINSRQQAILIQKRSFRIINGGLTKHLKTLVILVP